MTTDISCSRVTGRLSHFIDGQLPPDERRAVQQHLKSCSACRSTFRTTLRLGQRVRAVPTRLLPEGAAARANLEARRRRQDSLAGLRDGQSQRELQVSRPRAIAAAAALLVLGLWAGWSIAVVGGDDTVSALRPGAGSPTAPTVAKEEKDPGALRPMRPGRRVEDGVPPVLDEDPLKIDAVPANRDR